MKRASAGFFPPIPVDDDDPSKPMYVQLYDWFRSAIIGGHLRPGQKIPSSRQLASDLKVSRITILSAFEQLHAEGYLEGSVGSGTYVAKSIPDHTVKLKLGDSPRELSANSQHGPRRVSKLGSRFLSAPPLPRGFRAFQVGLPALDRFPRTTWSKLLIRHSRQTRKELMAYGNPMGRLACREAIAEYLSVIRGVRCQPAQIMIVTGSQQALDIAARVLLDPGDPVWIEEPAYPGAVRAFAAAGARLIPVRVDEEGLDVNRGIKRCPDARAAVITPSHQFPLGMTMSATRRVLLLDWATRNGSWIVEDDYDNEYRFGIRPISSLQGLDEDERVIYVGTFSKVLFPSLRIGYVIAPKDLITPFSRVRETSDIFPPPLHQEVLTDFIREGHLERHIRRMRMLYMERHDILVAEIRKNLGTSFEVMTAHAGTYLVMLLPDGFRDTVVAEKAAEADISTVPLSICYQEEPRRQGLILGYGGVNRRQIQEGVSKLAAILRKRH
ncbi:MAG: PLP-dependent aminotransferase family protein [Chthoniobacterales bacterium]|jgi:GntR family transcriptional regulator/MocR family aminotransferase